MMETREGSRSSACIHLKESSYHKTMSLEQIASRVVLSKSPAWHDSLLLDGGSCVDGPPRDTVAWPNNVRLSNLHPSSPSSFVCTLLHDMATNMALGKIDKMPCTRAARSPCLANIASCGHYPIIQERCMSWRVLEIHEQVGDRERHSARP
jgi:hypothetical protein